MSFESYYNEMYLADYVLPLKPEPRPKPREAAAWRSSRWTLRRENPAREYPLALDLRRQPDTDVAFESASQTQQQQQ